ncbi:uncharacterized protein TNCV_789181 [Trichonephila clavipes]|nr:uncharacterized protein TNCV_789181 [Trichonephila clavipes]
MFRSTAAKRDKQNKRETIRALCITTELDERALEQVGQKIYAAAFLMLNDKSIKSRFDLAAQLKLATRSRPGSSGYHGSTRGLLATDLVVLNHGKLTKTTPELVPLSLLPHHYNGRTFEPSIDLMCIAPYTGGSFNGTGLELVRCQPRSETLATRLPRPRYVEGLMHVKSIEVLTLEIWRSGEWDAS